MTLFGAQILLHLMQYMCTVAAYSVQTNKQKRSKQRQYLEPSLAVCQFVLFGREKLWKLADHDALIAFWEPGFYCS